MNNKKQDWRTADSNTKSTGRDQSQSDTSTERDSTVSDQPIAGKKPLNNDSSSQNAGAGRQSDNLSSRNSSRR